MGPVIYFQTTGVQTIRIQTREDGLSIDQIVLSSNLFRNSAPGALRNDTVILPIATGASENVIWALNIPDQSVHGSWVKSTDSTAAGDTVLRDPNNNGGKISSAAANPTDYFEATFNAEAGRPYRLWIRGKAENDASENDSVFVQFSGSVDANGASIYRIGTTSATIVNLEDCNGCDLSRWGWQDNGWGVGVLGPLIYFQTSGVQTIRIQTREDGLSIDQIVLSPQAYLSISPGNFRDDTVILPGTGGGSPTPPANQPPQVSITATPTSGLAPLFVSFRANASDPDGSIVSYNWVFGNGQTSSQAQPSITYQSTGTYTARLTVTDNSGASASTSLVITASSASSSAQLKVLSWNIAKSKGTDGLFNLDRTATWIANMNPDIVGLCEVMRNSGDDDAQQLADLLRQKTGRTWYWHWVAKYSGSREGNMILSKYSLQSTDGRYLSYSRSVAQARISVGGRTINFFATHLDPDSASVRARQVTELKSWMNNFAEIRIIAGDFNSQFTTSEILNFRQDYYDGWYTAVQDGTATAYPDNSVGSGTRTRRSRIDFVFYSKYTSNLVVRSAQVPDSRDLSNRNVVVSIGTRDDYGVRPSDHNHVIVTFDVR
jgi:endonuclease/exonuclease/phosphatase family metal-dependent hydrolase